MKKHLIAGSVILAIAVFFVFSSGKAAAPLSPIEDLGKKLFFDKALSSPAGQECAACHGPSVGFTGPAERFNKVGGVYEGAFKGRFGNRKPPAASYAGDSPKLHLDKEGNFVGGMFWDGRATGDVLGDPLAEQAMGPFMNPLEQNMPDKKSIILAVQKSTYARLFEEVWGKGSLDAVKNVDKTYELIARSIAAYERSAEVNPFSSKFDAFWRAATAKGLKVETIDADSAKNFKNLGLTEREINGLVLFNTKGMCAVCHVLTSVNGRPPVFTDYAYDNIGVPKNPDNPFYGQAKNFNPEGKAWVDKGLGGFLQTVDKYKSYAAANMGKHKVPTLRNVDERPTPVFVKAFMHNGALKSLKDVVRFYNTRDKGEAKWPAPEVKANLNTQESGNLGLTNDEENAIVDFMKTLTDKR
ncbi:MAG: cytochrome C [Candidatus Aminicenantes bacterium]|nr:cytochrome C [Candidatus Aminicenantes bacterium]